MKKEISNFTPIKMPPFVPSNNSRGMPVTISTTIHGDIGQQFEAMVAANNLNRSALLRQMIFHCLGAKTELEFIRRQILLWGTGDESNK